MEAIVRRAVAMIERQAALADRAAAARDATCVQVSRTLLAAVQALGDSRTPPSSAAPAKSQERIRWHEMRGAIGIGYNRKDT